MKLSVKELEELKENAAFLSKWSMLRLGQSLMIALYDINKSLYCEISTSHIDPFYKDSKIDDFFKYIIE